MTDVDEGTRAIGAWLSRFDRALQDGQVRDAADLFNENAAWRDLVAFTWNIHTFEGRDEIAAMLAERLAATSPSGWAIEGAAFGAPDAPEAFITFATQTGRGRGVLRLQNGKCSTLLTALYELEGFAEQRGVNRPRGAPEETRRGQRNWSDLRKSVEETLGISTQPDVVIVGGGQSGLGLAARFKLLNVSTLVIDRLPRVGDQWRSRYNSLCLHDPVWYDHLPYFPFPDHWPVFTPKDKIAEWLELYAKAMELDIWTSTECVGTAFDEATGRWEVRVVRDGKSLTLKPVHLVFAMGVAGKPEKPEFAGEASFDGPILHSSGYRGGEQFAGKRVAVIGSNNSAHDICADLWEQGAIPTMIQRSSTCVMRSEILRELMLSPLYSEEAIAGGMSTELADLLFASIPYSLMADQQKTVVAEIRERDAGFYKRLEDAGFLLDFGPEGSGIYVKFLQSASGYYIDVGASELVADGRIGLRSNVSVDHIEKNGVALSNGDLLEADAIICATGFGPMDEWIRQLLPADIAKGVGPCWGYGAGTPLDPGPWVGELRNMWKPLSHPNLWVHGGNLQLGRHYSRYLALQIKAKLEGLPVQPYPPRA